MLFQGKAGRIGDNQVITAVRIASDPAVFQQYRITDLFIGVGSCVPGVYVHGFAGIDITQLVGFDVNIYRSAEAPFLGTGNCRNGFFEVLFKGILCRWRGSFYAEFNINPFVHFCGIKGDGII